MMDDWNPDTLWDVAYMLLLTVVMFVVGYSAMMLLLFGVVS